MKEANYIVEMTDSRIGQTFFIESMVTTEVAPNFYSTGNIEEAETMCYSTATFLALILNKEFNKFGQTFKAKLIG